MPPLTCQTSGRQELRRVILPRKNRPRIQVRTAAAKYDKVGNGVPIHIGNSQSVAEIGTWSRQREIAVLLRRISKNVHQAICASGVGPDDQLIAGISVDVADGNRATEV